MYEYMKIKGLDSREITSLPDSKNVINMTFLFSHRQDSFACNESLYNTVPDLLASPSKFCSLKYSFTFSKVINYFKR